MQIDLATGQLNQALFNSEELENKSQSLHQNILAMTDIQEKCKIPEDREEKLKQELSILETHRSTNMIDCREAEMLKQETEETCRLQREEKKEEISVILQVNTVIFQCAFFHCELNFHCTFSMKVFLHLQ